MKDKKLCRHCGNEKPTYMFHKQFAAKDGLYPVCKDCRSRTQGHTPRRVRPTKNYQQPTYEELVNDVLEMAARKPNDFMLADVARKLRIDPYCKPSELAVDLLYTVWERHMREMVDMTEFDVNAPILNDNTKRRDKKWIDRGIEVE